MNGISYNFSQFVKTFLKLPIQDYLHKVKRMAQKDEKIINKMKKMKKIKFANLKINNL